MPAANFHANFLPISNFFTVVAYRANTDKSGY